MAPLPGGGRLADRETGLTMTDPLGDFHSDRPEAESAWSVASGGSMLKALSRFAWLRAVVAVVGGG